jgi:hypothetical protein
VQAAARGARVACRAGVAASIVNLQGAKHWRFAMMDSSPYSADSASEEISMRIEDLGDWRGETLARVRQLIKEAEPEVIEEVKWRKPSNSMVGVPVWSLNGILCTGEIYKEKVKFTFASGAALSDPAGLFNSSLGGNVRRAIDFHEGDEINETALKALILEAVELNRIQKR